MNRCKICGCLGLFSVIAESGLCSNCSHILSMEVAERSRRIDASLRGAEQTINPGSKIARLDESLAQLEALAQYERRGIATLKDSPAALMDEVRLRKDAVVEQAAQEDVREAMSHIQEAALPERKIDLYSALLLRLREYAHRMGRPEKILELDARVHAGLRHVRLNVPLDRARLAEKRGQNEKALSAYREALDFMRSSDPERAALARHIPEIEKRIRELESPPKAVR